MPRGVTLAPIYDNISALGLENGSILRADWNLKGKISTADEVNPSMSDYVKEFKRLNFQSTLRPFFEKISLAAIQTQISQSFVSDLMKDALQRLVKNRLEEFRVELHS